MDNTEENKKINTDDLFEINETIWMIYVNNNEISYTSKWWTEPNE